MKGRAVPDQRPALLACSPRLPASDSSSTEGAEATLKASEAHNPRSVPLHRGLQNGRKRLLTSIDVGRWQFGQATTLDAGTDEVLCSGMVNMLDLGAQGQFETHVLWRSVQATIGFQPQESDGDNEAIAADLRDQALRCIHPKAHQLVCLAFG